MPSNTKNSMSQLLFAIISQTGTKDIDWSKVANDPFLLHSIKTGQTARNRYDRFVKSMIRNKPNERRRLRERSSRVAKPSSRRDLHAKDKNMIKTVSGANLASDLQATPDASSYIEIPGDDVHSFRLPIPVPSSVELGDRLFNDTGYDCDTNAVNSDESDPLVELGLQSPRSFAGNVAGRSENDGKLRPTELQIELRPHDLGWCVNFYLRLRWLGDNLRRYVKRHSVSHIVVIVAKSGDDPNECKNEDENVVIVQNSRQTIRYALLAINDVSETSPRIKSLQIRIENIAGWDCLLQNSNDGARPFFKHISRLEIAVHCAGACKQTYETFDEICRTLLSQFPRLRHFSIISEEDFAQIATTLEHPTLTDSKWCCLETGGVRSFKVRTPTSRPATPSSERSLTITPTCTGQFDPSGCAEGMPVNAQARVRQIPNSSLLQDDYARPGCDSVEHCASDIGGNRVAVEAAEPGYSVDDEGYVEDPGDSFGRNDIQELVKIFPEDGREYRYDHKIGGPEGYLSHCPNDQSKARRLKEEADRLYLVYRMWRDALGGKHYLSNLKDISAPYIVDAKCNAGHWVTSVAEALNDEGALVCGYDVLAFQPEIDPHRNYDKTRLSANMEFLTLEKDQRPEVTGVDLLFIRDGKVDVSEGYRSLKPGGWLEIHQISWYSLGKLRKGSMIEKFADTMAQALEKFGDWTAISTSKEEMLNNGFTSIVLESFPCSTELFKQAIVDHLESLSLFLFTQFMGMSSNEVKIMIAIARSQMNDLGKELLIQVDTLRGRRPLETI